MPIDHERPARIVGSDWAVQYLSASKYGLVGSLVRPTYLAVELSCSVCGLNLSLREHPLLGCYSGEHRVRVNAIASILSRCCVKKYRPEGCSWNAIMEPSTRCTLISAAADVSIVMRHTFLTSASDRMLAMDALLYHMGPKFGKSPIISESWWPPFVNARSTCGLRRMLESIAAFLKTEIVDCESNTIQFGSMPALFDCANMYAYCVSVVPVVAGLPCGQSLA